MNNKENQWRYYYDGFNPGTNEPKRTAKGFPKNNVVY
jgi:hypothetical protein